MPVDVECRKGELIISGEAEEEQKAEDTHTIDIMLVPYIITDVQYYIWLKIKGSIVWGAEI